MVTRSSADPSPFAAFASSLAISAPSCLQGVHCPHDSTARKRETPAATLTTSVPSRDHDVSRRAETAADALHPLVAQFGVELICGQHGTGHADQHRADLDAAHYAAGGCIDGDAQRGAHRYFDDAGMS